MSFVGWDFGSAPAYNVYVDTQMSDFKVGDVVRFKEFNSDTSGRTPPALVGRTAKVLHTDEEGWTHLEAADNFVGGGWDPQRLELVSRPSDAKPTLRVGDSGPGWGVQPLHPAPALKPGDRIVTKRGTPGVLVGDSNVPGFRWSVELPDHKNGGVYVTNLREYEVMPAPTLKVGDRVCMKPRGSPAATGTIARQHFSGPHEWSVQPAGMKSCYGFNADELELLPSEPVQANKGLHPKYLEARAKADAESQYKREMLGMWPPLEPPHTKSMTATAASRKPLLVPDGGPMALEEVEAFRRAILASYPALKTYWDAPPDGWMPAGTYMPLGDEDEGDETRSYDGTLGDGTPFRFVRYKRMDIPLTAEGGPGIAQSIPHYERRFPSRVATWGPYADYDLLPDAD